MDTPVIRRKRTFVVKQGKACTDNATRPPKSSSDGAQTSQGENDQGELKKPQKTPENPPVASSKATKPRKRKKPVFSQPEDGIALLIEHWPQLFSETNPKPLKLGIWDDLVATEKVSRRQLRAALKIYCRGKAYRQTLAAGGQRYDINGQPVAAITDEHQKNAEQSLKPRRKKPPKDLQYKGSAVAEPDSDDNAA